MWCLGVSQVELENAVLIKDSLKQSLQLYQVLDEEKGIVNLLFQYKLELLDAKLVHIYVHIIIVSEVMRNYLATTVL